jgi:hypothetical protein
MSPKQSDNWRAVSQFMSDLRNVSRLAAYVDTVVDVYESGAWREYTDATGRSDHWREAEFDYFLIACGAQYGEVQRLLTWDRARAVELASAMDSDNPTRRRPLPEVSDQWTSPVGASLVKLAERQGWTKGNGRLRVAPAPQRARARARTGVTVDEHAREGRANRLEQARREVLDELADVMLAETSDELELRYLIDRLRADLTRRRNEPTASD